MRNTLLALLFGIAIVPAAGVAHAADEPDCEGWAAQQALPLLLQSQAMTSLAVSPPGAYGPSPAWAPLVQPWGAGPAGLAALYGPAPSYGPLGPGLTAYQLGALQQLQSSGTPAALAAGNAGAAAAAVPGLLLGAIGPGGIANLVNRAQLGLNDLSVNPPQGNTGAAISAAFQRQAEISRLQQRYQVGATYELAAVGRALEYAVQAGQTYRTLVQDCQDQVAAAAAGAPRGP
jgi:hypothetical protein